MTEGATFPDVVAFSDGTDTWLADGFQREAAARQAGADGLSADIRQGTKRDALLYACGANADHGSRRTPKEKERAVKAVLSDPEWATMSDRWVAEKCHVSSPYVAKIRPTVNDCSRKRNARRKGRDGKMRTAPPPKKKPKKSSARPNKPKAGNKSLFGQFTRKELLELAEKITKKVIAGVSFQSNAVEKALQEMEGADWQQSMIEVVDDVRGLLVQQFGTSD